MNSFITAKEWCKHKEETTKCSSEKFWPRTLSTMMWICKEMLNSQEYQKHFSAYPAAQKVFAHFLILNLFNIFYFWNMDVCNTEHQDVILIRKHEVSTNQWKYEPSVIKILIPWGTGATTENRLQHQGENISLAHISTIPGKFMDKIIFTGRI